MKVKELSSINKSSIPEFHRKKIHIKQLKQNKYFQYIKTIMSIRN
jgi:hypothetical protein